MNSLFDYPKLRGPFTLWLPNTYKYLSVTMFTQDYEVGYDYLYILKPNQRNSSVITDLVFCHETDNPENIRITWTFDCMKQKIYTFCNGGVDGDTPI